MRNILRGFRFWLSWLIFEKWLKWEQAQPKGERIVRKTKEWNNYIQNKKCSRCNVEMVTDRSGSEGLFSSPNSFWRCPVCQNTVSKDTCRFEFENLDDERLVRDGDEKYRYALFTPIQKAILFVLLLFGVVFGLSAIMVWG